MSDQIWPGRRGDGRGTVQASRDPLDLAIDRVAARLVSVNHDAAMADRIVAQLPVPSGRWAWTVSLVPQAAVAILVAMLAFAWTASDRGSGLREASSSSVAGVRPARREGSEPAEQPRGTMAAIAIPPLPATRALRGPENEADHERSLESVAALIPLDVAALEGPMPLDQAPVFLGPIVLTDLPLSSDPSPRR